MFQSPSPEISSTVQRALLFYPPLNPPEPALWYRLTPSSNSSSSSPPLSPSCFPVREDLEHTESTSFSVSSDRDESSGCSVSIETTTTDSLLGSELDLRAWKAVTKELVTNFKSEEKIGKQGEESEEQPRHEEKQVSKGDFGKTKRKRRKQETWGVDRKHPVYKGVRQRSWGKWVSEIREPKKKTRIWLGSFSSAEMAARAYDVGAISLRGDNTPLNFPNLAHTLPRPLTLSPKDIQTAAAAAAAAIAPSVSTQSRAVHRTNYMRDEEDDEREPVECQTQSKAGGNPLKTDVSQFRSGSFKTISTARAEDVPCPEGKRERQSEVCAEEPRQIQRQHDAGTSQTSIVPAIDVSLSRYERLSSAQATEEQTELQQNKHHIVDDLLLDMHLLKDMASAMLLTPPRLQDDTKESHIDDDNEEWVLYLWDQPCSF